MPIPAKPCPGTFSEQTLAQLASNRDRAQWTLHPCATCGQQVGAVLEKGAWQPEKHWPSVRYAPRAKRAERRTPAAAKTPNTPAVPS